MPELPEVESYTRYFAKHALGQKVVRVDVRDERILTVRKDQLTRALRNRSFATVRRHGKHLFASIEGDGWLHLHFGMSGDLAYYRDEAEAPRFTRVVFDFDNGAHLAFEDMRLFGYVDLVDDPDSYISEHNLGLDPLDPAFNLRAFRKVLEGRRGAMKSLLMSQEVIAGLGNLYVDEALFRSGIHPRRSVDKLKPDEAKSLFTNIGKVLRDVISEKKGARRLPREEDERCPMCGGSVKRTVVFGRTTYYCGKHQR